MRIKAALCATVLTIVVEPEILRCVVTVHCFQLHSYTSGKGWAPDACQPSSLLTL